MLLGFAELGIATFAPEAAALNVVPSLIGWITDAVASVRTSNSQDSVEQVIDNFKSRVQTWINAHTPAVDEFLNGETVNGVYVPGKIHAVTSTANEIRNDVSLGALGKLIKAKNLYADLSLNYPTDRVAPLSLSIKGALAVKFADDCGYDLSWLPISEVWTSTDWNIAFVLDGNDIADMLNSWGYRPSN